MQQEITKGQLVDVALKHLTLSGALINPSPRDKSDFLTFLEMMVASMTNEGIQIGYKLSEFGLEPDASEDSGLSIDNSSAIALNLAVYGAASKGMVLLPSLMNSASHAKRGLFSVEPVPMESNSMLPAGAGNNYIGTETSDYQSVQDNLTVEKDGQIDELTL